MDNITLKKLQNTEIEILDVIDNFCKNNNIQYSLAAGTALGAVRHGGFIPWDDDIDVAMSRVEYNRFINEWIKQPVSGYYLENCIIDKYCGNCHSKLRKDNTLIASKSDDLSKGHHGIWVDIFPLDKLSSDQNKKRLTIKHGKRIILLSRANHVCHTDNLRTKFVRSFIGFIPYNIRYSLLEKSVEWLTNNNNEIKENFNWISMSSFSSLSKIYPQNMLDETINIKFEDRIYKIYKEYDAMLRCLYGDYLKLPPVEKRICTHSPLIIQF